MYEIHILEIFDPWAKLPDRAQFVFDFEDNLPQAELRALRWLEGRPNDIVMLVTLDVCAHCGETIDYDHEHKIWFHTSGRHGRVECRTYAKTSAWPKVNP